MLADAQGVPARDDRAQRRPHRLGGLDRRLLRRAASGRLLLVEGGRAQPALQPRRGARRRRRGRARHRRARSPRRPHRLDRRLPVLPARHAHAAGRRSQRVCLR